MNFSSLTKLATNLLLSDIKIDLCKINFDHDKTTRLLIKEKKILDVRIFTKEKMVFCGGKFVKDFINKKFPKIKIKLNFKDGDEVKKNSDLILLNKNYPLKGKSCFDLQFQRSYDGSTSEQFDIYEITKTSFINQGLVFFGGFACSLYGKYMPKKQRKQKSTTEKKTQKTKTNNFKIIKKQTKQKQNKKHKQQKHQNKKTKTHKSPRAF